MGCDPLGTLGMCSRRIFCVSLWEFVHFSQYSDRIQKPTVQAASQKLDERLVSSATPHHRLGIRHVVHTDALSVGLQLYEARQGRGAAVVKRRKRHVDQ